MVSPAKKEKARSISSAGFVRSKPIGPRLHPMAAGSHQSRADISDDPIVAQFARKLGRPLPPFRNEPVTNWRDGFQISSKSFVKDRRPECSLVRERDVLACGTRCAVHKAPRLILEMVEARTRFSKYHRLVIVAPVVKKEKRWRRKRKARPFHIKMEAHLALPPFLAFAVFRVGVVNKNHASFAGCH